MLHVIVIQNHLDIVTYGQQEILEGKMSIPAVVDDYLVFTVN
jgi:hypothetical protein